MIAMDTVKFDDFAKLDIRIGTIVSAEKVPETDKLLRLEIDFGEEKRQLVAGIAETYSADELVGKQLPVLVNLETKKIRGLESQGMILAVVIDNKAVLLHPEKPVPKGSKVG